MAVKVISEEKFYEFNIPIKNKLRPDAPFDGCMFETFGAELDFVYAYAKSYVWTIIECGDDLMFISGLHYVNRIGYIITQRPFDGNIEVYCNCKIY